MDQWSIPQVGAWLEANGFGHHREQFHKEAISGEVLLMLSKDDLKNDLGVSQFGERKRMLELIQQAARGQTPRETPAQPVPQSPPPPVTPVQEEQPWRTPQSQESLQPTSSNDPAPMDLNTVHPLLSSEGPADVKEEPPPPTSTCSGAGPMEVDAGWQAPPTTGWAQVATSDRQAAFLPEADVPPPDHEGAEAYLASMRRPAGIENPHVSSNSEAFATEVQSCDGAEPYAASAKPSLEPPRPPAGSTMHALAVFPVPAAHLFGHLEATLRCAPGGSGFVRLERQGKSTVAVYSDGESAAKAVQGKGVWADGDLFVTLQPTTLEELPSEQQQAPQSPLASSIPTPCLARQASVTCWQGPAASASAADAGPPARAATMAAAPRPSSQSAPAPQRSLFVKGLQPHSDASSSEWQRRALLEAVCRLAPGMKGLVEDVAFCPRLGAARVRVADLDAVDTILGAVGPEAQLEVLGKALRILPPGSPAANELVHAVPLHAASSLDASELAVAVSAGLAVKGVHVEVSAFRGLCAVTFPDPEVAEIMCVGGMDLDMRGGAQAAVHFFPRCTSFFLSGIPVGVDGKEVADTICHAANGASVEHCEVDGKDGTGILLVQEGDGASMVACIKELSLRGGTLRLSSEQSHPIYMEQLPEGVTEGEILRELGKLHFRPQSVVIQGRHAEINLKSADDRDQAVKRSVTLRNTSVALHQRRAVCIPFSENWYATRVKDLPPVDAIPRDDPAFQTRTWDAHLWAKHFERFQQSSDREEKNSGLHGMRKAAMLATVQAVRKGQYVALFPGHSEERTVKLDSAPPPTKFYNMEDGISLPKDPRPQHFTRVCVVAEDCMEQARLIWEQTGDVPLVLNMASDKQTGGGFLTGDGAQEETIFRRSNYYSTLGGLDDAAGPRYPWPGKFCAAFSAGVTVFRGTEREGYPFLPKPYTLDFVAVAAERNPPLTEAGELPPEHVAILRRKIELIFLVALMHRKRHLVLSALGCGAYHNPPSHVAEIFRAVLFQYGALFRSITFAIVEDHNSKGGNVEPFRVALHELDVPSHASFRWLPDAAVPAVPCQHGGLCRSRGNAAHCQQFAHPPLCTFGSNCPKDHLVHAQLFAHRVHCERGGECSQAQDKAHCEIFDHPPECAAGASCTRCDPEHLKKAVHSVPVCKFGPGCAKKGGRCHYRHLVPHCQAGSCCTGLLDAQHASDYDHGVLPLCEQLLCCDREPRDHRQKRAHLCAFGTSCKELKAGNTQHLRQYIHLSRPACRQGPRCTEFMDPVHIAAFSHAELAGGVEWPREECRFGGSCHNWDARHRCEFMHPPDVARLPPCPVRGQLLRHNMDLYAARGALTEALRQHKEAIGPDEAPGDVVQWVRQLRPLHRCKLEIFESMCAHGVLMSASHMKALGDADAAVRAAQTHPEITAFLHEAASVEHRHILDHVADLVRLEYGKDHKSRVPATDLAKLEKAVENSTRAVKGLKMRRGNLDQIVQTAKDVAKASLHLKESYASTGIHYHVDEKMGTNQHIFSIIGPHTGCYYGGVVLVLKQEVMHHPDFFLTVNAATSYHSGRAGKWRPWCDVVTNTDPSAAVPLQARLLAVQTQVQTLQNQITSLQQRALAAPWDQSLQAQLDQRRADLAAAQGQSGSTSSPESRNIGVFRKSALHPCVHQWDRIVAAELSSMAKHVKHLAGSASLDEVLQFWKDADSHTVIEGHLPEVVPLGYVERILVPGDLRLSEKTMQVLKSCFGDRLKDVLKLGDIKASRDEEERNTHGGYPKAMARTEPFAVPRDTQAVAPLRGLVVSLPGGMAKQQEEAVIPLTYLPTRGLNHLYLSVPTNDTYGNPTELFVTIASTTSVADENRKQVCIFLTSAATEKSMCYVTTNLPALHEVVQQQHKYRIATAKHFSAGSVRNGHIDYHIELDVQSHSLTVAHAGMSAMFSPKKMEASCRSLLDFDRKLYVSLSTWEHEVCVSGISVRKDILPIPQLSGSSKDNGSHQQNGHKSNESGEQSADGSSGGVLKKAFNMINGAVQSVLSRGEAGAPPKWQVKIGDSWEDFDEQSRQLLEDALAKKEKTVKLSVKGRDFEVDLEHMKQKSTKGGRVRSVQRCTPSDETSPKSGSKSSADQGDRNEETRVQSHVWQVRLNTGWEEFEGTLSRMFSEKEASGEKTVQFKVGKDPRGRAAARGGGGAARGGAARGGPSNEQPAQGSRGGRGQASQSHNGGTASGDSHPAFGQSSRGKGPVWQVSMGASGWIDMEEDVDKRLRAAKEAKQSTCRFFCRGQEYEVDFESMKQVNLKTGKERAVRPPPS